MQISVIVRVVDRIAVENAHAGLAWGPDRGRHFIRVRSLWEKAGLLPIFLLGAWGKSWTSQSPSALTCNLGIMMIKDNLALPPKDSGGKWGSAPQTQRTHSSAYDEYLVSNSYFWFL